MRTNRRRFLPPAAVVDCSLNKTTCRSVRTPSFGPKATLFVGDHDHAWADRDAHALTVFPDEV